MLSDGIVQARFTPGGTVYHYHCPVARIGDRIRSDGMYSDSAEVVGFGRTNGYTGYCKPARVVQRSKPMNAAEQLQRAIYPGQQACIPIYKEAPAMHDFPDTVEDRIQKMERLLKEDRKKAKAARKAAAAKKAALKEQRRQRKVAIATFEDVAVDLGQPAAARVAAAVELLKATK